MGEQMKWITKNGNSFPIKIKSTSEYMNNLIRNKGKYKLDKKEEDEMVTLYHGSPYKFDKFNLEMARTNQHYLNRDEGHYFTDDEEIARNSYGEEGYVYEVKVPKSKIKKSGTYLGQGDYEDNIFVVNDDNAINVVKRNKINKYYDKYNVKEELNGLNRRIESFEKSYDQYKNNPNYVKYLNDMKERKEWLDSIPKYEDGKPVSIKTKLYSINEDIRTVKKNMEKDKQDGNIVSYEYLEDRLKELEKRKKQLEKQNVRS